MINSTLPKDVYLCLDCGTCTSLCRVAFLADSNPRLFRWKTKEELVKYLYLCTLCGRCKEGCPRGVDTKRILLSLREYLYKEEMSPKQFLLLAEAVEEEGNIANFPNIERGMWGDFLEMPLSEKKEAEVLYFVGCMGSFSPPAQEIPQAFATVMQRLGIDFIIMGEREECCGYPLLVGGMKEKAMSLIQGNTERIKEIGAKIMVFSCPSCYYTFLNYYPLDVKMFHYTEYLALYLEEGRLPLGPLSCTVMYHDPCDLGRACGVYDAPRKLISAIPGVRSVETKKSRNLSLCCGGGGNLEVLEQVLPTKLASILIDEAMKLGVEFLLTACQQCKRTLQKSANGKIKVMDLSSFILLSMEKRNGD